ncbi:unnamed protein product [Haemonchus placei]|uniref:Glycosyltransferase n=1 Tax=Haemonchus placei TaxID=6290 RepID=A0A0N4X992_HAEPC|nr:unnamed protein product [Haemonchus placei]
MRPEDVKMRNGFTGQLCCDGPHYPEYMREACPDLWVSHHGILPGSFPGDRTVSFRHPSRRITPIAPYPGLGSVRRMAAGASPRP